MEFVIVKGTNGLGEPMYQVRNSDGAAVRANRWGRPEIHRSDMWLDSLEYAQYELLAIEQYYQEQARQRVNPDVVVVQRITVEG